MPIQGALRELGIHDVFQLLDLSRKTGRLRVTSALRNNEGTVLFRDGRVVSATTRSNPHPLGAVLLRAGRITAQELEQARAVQQASDKPRLLGEVLRSRRVAQGRSLRDLCAEASVSLGYMSEIERGQKEASSELLASICAALDAPLSEILSEVADAVALEEARVSLRLAEEIGATAELTGHTDDDVVASAA